jgi:hypothetical protein
MLPSNTGSMSSPNAVKSASARLDFSNTARRRGARRVMAVLSWSNVDVGNIDLDRNVSHVNIKVASVHI